MAPPLRILLLLAVPFLLLTPPLHAQPPGFDWVKNMGGHWTDGGWSVQVDTAGNIYSTGYFSDTVDFDPGPGTYNLIASSNTDIFVSKLDSAGNFLWAKQMSGPLNDQGRMLALDAQGNVYITGWFRDTVDFDPGPGVFNLVATGTQHAFVCKLDNAGNFLWAGQMGGTAVSVAQALALDNAGNVYLTGSFQSASDFDPGPGTYLLTPSGLSDIFVCCLDASGNFSWARQLTGSTSQSVSGSGIAVNAAGEVFVTGIFSDTVDFDPGPASYLLNSVNSSSDIFLLKLTASGNLIWVQQFGSSSADLSAAIALDHSGNVYITGSFLLTVDFDGGPGIFNLSAPVNGNVFVSKYTSAGNLAWAKQIGSTHGATGWGICTDRESSVYSTGYFLGVSDFDPGPGVFNLTASNSFYAGYMSKLDSAGNFAWAAQISSSNDLVSTICVDSSLSVYTSGSFQNVCDFDPGPGTHNVNGAGYGDVFILKLKQCPAPAAPLNTSLPSALEICAGEFTSLQASGTGSIGWYDAASGGNYLGGGNTFTTPLLTDTMVYYVQDSLCASSATRTAITVIVHPLPGVVANAAATHACTSDGPLALTGTPAGGAWFGTGVNGNAFLPSSSGAGVWTLTYAYIDSYGCSATDTLNMTVGLCTGIDPAFANAVFQIQQGPDGQPGFLANGNAGEVWICDAQGRTVAQFSLQPGVLQEVHLAAPGMYTVRFLSADGKPVNRKMLVR